MIAAAMTTRNPGLPTYADLAKAGAAIARDIAPHKCARLEAMVADLQAVHTQLRFHLDEYGQVCVDGQASASAQLACQLCTEPVTLRVQAELEGVLVFSEHEAQQLLDTSEGRTVIVVSGPELNEVELVEDELLLQLPTQVCADVSCERRPPMGYGPVIEGEQADTYRPFAVLAELSSEE